MAAPSCPDCLRGFMKADTSTGTVAEIHGLDTYIAKPKGDPKGLIVMIPDLFGWDAGNGRILADSLANDGDFLVYLPDFMKGTAPPLGTSAIMDSVLEPAPSIFTTVFYKPIWFVQFASKVAPFLMRNKDSIMRPRIYDFHRALRSDPATANLPLGSAGYCWGGKYTIHLCQEGLVDAGFTAHPSKMEFPADWAKVQKPLAIAIGDVDMLFDVKAINAIKDVLEANKDVPSEVVIYEAAKHGFAIRADPADEVQTKSAVESQVQSVKWFKEHLTAKEEQN